MKVSSVDNAIASWTTHKSQVASHSSNVSEIETFTVRCLLLMLISEYENVIEKMFCKRAQKANDPDLHSFVKTTISRSFRSPDLGKINEHLKRLGVAHRDRFQAEIEVNQPEVKAAWDSLMLNRHNVVHGVGTFTIGWQDFIDAYNKSQVMMTELANTLGLTQTDLASL